MAAPALYPDLQKRFDQQRTQVGQRVSAARQQNQDALKRRFAAIGGLNSGAAIKQQQLADDTANQQREQGMAAVNDLEAQAREVQVNRDFQSGEAQKQRDFQSKQSDIDRQFQDKVFQFDKESKLKQLDLQSQDLALRRDENEFNKRMAQLQADRSGGLFGGGGFLGLGL